MWRWDLEVTIIFFYFPIMIDWFVYMKFNGTFWLSTHWLILKNDASKKLTKEVFKHSLGFSQNIVQKIIIKTKPLN